MRSCDRRRAKNKAHVPAGNAAGREKRTAGDEKEREGKVKSPYQASGGLRVSLWKNRLKTSGRQRDGRKGRGRLKDDREQGHNTGGLPDSAFLPNALR